MKKLLLALTLLVASAAPAFAQCNGVFANNTVCGNVTGAANLPRPTNPSAFLGAAGGSNGQTQYNNGGALGGYTPSGDVTVNPATGVETIQPSAVTNSKLAANAIALYPTRTIAAGLDLSAFSAIQTLGYSVAGDGGAATFQKKSPGTAFLDTYINNNTSPPTLVGGSGYTNGTYLGVALGGGVGLGCSGQVTVAGGAVTAVSLAVPCAGYKVGDVLTAVNSFLGGTGSGFTWTVVAISTPQGSFTDTAGNLWQYAPAGIPNVLQFGCKGDWNGVDGSATNNAACLWSAASWANVPISTSSAQVQGNLLYFPRGAYMVCGNWNSTIYTVPVPHGVHFTSGGFGTATLLECATNSPGTYFIELCDSNALTGQFGCKVSGMTINSSQIVTSTAGGASIYSNAGQQFPLLENVEIQPGLKSCYKYEIGKGGAANDIQIGTDCAQVQGATNPAISLNASSVQHIIKYSSIGCTGTGCTTAISNADGRLVVDGLDIENYATGLLQNVATAGNQSTYANVQQNSNHCTQAITLGPSNVPGNITFTNVQTGCPQVLTNGQPSGTSYNGTIRGPLMCPPTGTTGACGAAQP